MSAGAAIGALGGRVIKLTVFSAGAGTVGGLSEVTGGSLSVAAAEVAPVRGGVTREVGGFCAAGIEGSGGADAAGAADEAGGLGVDAGATAAGGVTEEMSGLAGTEAAGVIRAVDGCALCAVPGATRAGAARGGVARRVTARRCEAEGALSPVSGGASRDGGVEPIEGAAVAAGETEAGFAGMGGLVLAEVGIGELPGRGGSGVILAVGTSPGTGAREVAAGRGGSEGEADGGVAAGPEASPLRAGFAGTDPVAGLAGKTVDPVRSGPVAGRTGVLGGSAEAGVADVRGCCGARVSGITTGPVRRGAPDAGVSRREAVWGRLLKTGPAAGGVTRPVADGLAVGRSGGRASGTMAEACRLGAGVSRREAVGGRNAPVAGFAGEGVPESAGGCCVRLRGMKTGADFRARVGTEGAVAPAGGRVKPVEAGVDGAVEGFASEGVTVAGALVPAMGREILPEAGRGAVDGRDEPSIWEAAAFSKPPEAGRVSGGRGRVGGRAGAGAVVRRN